MIAPTQRTAVKAACIERRRLPRRNGKKHAGERQRDAPKAQTIARSRRQVEDERGGKPGCAHERAGDPADGELPRKRGRRNMTPMAAGMMRNEKTSSTPAIATELVTTTPKVA